jgi:predicted nucleic-acid-binding Zn-ribbon protein
MGIFFMEHADEEQPGEVEFPGKGPARYTSRIEKRIADRFTCAKCGGTACSIREVAMTGTGLSKLLDIQHNHYLFVSCRGCGFVEIYDPNILRGKKAGELGRF